MSRWAHVAGVIRYDCAYHKDDLIKETLGKMYRWNDGKQFEYGSPEYKAYRKERKSAFDLRKKHIPMGSEGSLEYKILHEGIIPDEDGHISLMADTEVIIWGDLRDVNYNSINYIKKWFKRATCNSKLFVRQAVLQIDDEWSDSLIILTYHEDWNCQKRDAEKYIIQTVVPRFKEETKCQS